MNGDSIAGCRIPLSISTLSHHINKFGGHRCCRSADVRFPICHMTMLRNNHVILWTWFLCYQTATDRRSCGRANIRLFIVRYKVPMPRFTNGLAHLQKVFFKDRSRHCRSSKKKSILKNLVRFTEKHLHRSLFFEKLQVSDNFIYVKFFWK